MTTPSIDHAAEAAVLPSTYTIRSFRWDDLPQIVNVYNRFYEATGNEGRIDTGQLDMVYHLPNFNAETDVWVVSDANGAIIASAEIEIGREPGRNWADHAVDPAHWGQGIENYLIHISEDAAAERTLTRFGTDQPVSLERTCLSTDTATADRFRAYGYRHVRSFYRMMIDLTALDDIAMPTLPNGIELRPFAIEQMDALYRADEEAFADHWGFATETFEEWNHWMLKRPETDPSMWMIAWDGDEIAAFSINRPYGVDHPEWGWIGLLGTRRAWRKRGLASALLRTSFKQMKERGFVRAGLGVDASSLTNAVALYQSVGMSVASQRDVYAKMLRGETLPIYPAL